MISIRPVAVQTNRVSMYTEKAWTRPCLAGWETSAEAAEGVAVAMPVSEEKMARLVPQIMALPMAAPMI